MRSLFLVVLILGASSTAAAQAARELGSPWPRDAVGGGGMDVEGEGSPYDPYAPTTDAPDDTRPAEPPQDIHAEGGATVGPRGVVVPEGYSTAVVPTPGVYPGAVPRLEPTDTLRLPSGIVTRIRALDADMQILAARGGGSVLDGVLALLSGGLSIAIGIIIDPAVMGGSSGSFSPYLYTYGSGMVLRGILDLALMTNPGAVAATYAHMPMRNPREVRERLRYGERELAHLAEMAAISRYVDGGLNVALGLAVIPIYIAPNGFNPEDPFSYLVLLGAAVSVTTGLIAIFTTSEAERRWGAYSELRDRLSSTPEGADDDAELDELAGDGGGESLTLRAGLGGLSLDVTF
jgi:hypothetical protein